MSVESPRASRLEPYLSRQEPAPTLLKMLVGVQLTGARDDAGLSQEQAARALGFSPAKLSRIEAGKGRKPPRRPMSGPSSACTGPTTTRCRSCCAFSSAPVSRDGGSATTSG